MAKSPKAAKRDDFPKQLYIHRAGEGDGQYFEANETIESIDETDADADVVAIYELREVKRLRITRLLE